MTMTVVKIGNDAKKPFDEPFPKNDEEVYQLIKKLGQGIDPAMLDVFFWLYRASKEEENNPAKALSETLYEILSEMRLKQTLQME